MNTTTYIKNVGQIKPTFSSSVCDTTKKFFDPEYQRIQESKRVQHARMINSFLYKC